VRHLPTPLLTLLAAATLTANLVVLDDAVTAAAVEVAEAARVHDDVGGSSPPAVRDPRVAAATVRADAARLQGRADAWPVTQAGAPAPDPQGDGTETRGAAAAEDGSTGSAEAGPAHPDDASGGPQRAPDEPAVDATPPTPTPRVAPEPTPEPTPTPSPAPARPAPEVDDPDDCDHRCRGERLHGQLRIHEPPRWTVVYEDEHPAYLGLADSRTRTITLYLRASLPDRVMLWTLYHEVGHSHDFTYLNTAKRDRWSAARGYEGETWFGCNHCTDYETPAGDWAESFASCHTGWDDQWRSELGDPPTTAQCELLHELRQP
jgi:hypothetical protein